MINRKSLAVFIPILLASSNEVNAVDIFNNHGNKLELYGSINPNHELSHGFLSTHIESYDDNTNSILGLSGKINITDKLSSYAQIEYKADLFLPEEPQQQQKSNSIRLGYAGLKYGDWGSIDYGRNYGIMHDVQSITDRAPFIIKNSLFEYNDSYMLGRNNSLLTYRNDNIFGLSDGLSFALQYQDQIKNKISSKKKYSGWGASLKYKSNIGLTAIGSFFTAQKPDSYNKNHLKNSFVDAYGLGFKYDANDIYIAAFYGAARNVTPLNIHQNNSLSPDYINMTQNIEAIAEYNFHSGFHPSLSYLDSKGHNSNNNLNKNNVELAKQISIATRYEFNKNISAYMNYKINLLKENHFVIENNITTDNMIGAGIVYQF